MLVTGAELFRFGQQESGAEWHAAGNGSTFHFL